MSTQSDRRPRPAQVKASLPLLLVISVIGVGLILLGGDGVAHAARLPQFVGWLALMLFGLMLACSLPSALLGRRGEESPGAARAAGRIGFAVFALFTGAGVFGVMALVLSLTSS